MSRVAERPAGVPRRRRTSGSVEILSVVVVAVVLSWLLKTLLVQAFYIPSGSMEDTLQVGDRILVNKLVDGQELQRGDVVVFEDPGGWLQEADDGVSPLALVRGVFEYLGRLPVSEGVDLVKRVIGVPGDHVMSCDRQGRMTINGMALPEPYLYPGDVASMDPFDVRVPPGHLWVLGDHRSVSEDSRRHRERKGGFVPMHKVAGRAFLVAWPMANALRLHQPEVFSSPGLDRR